MEPQTPQGGPLCNGRQCRYERPTMTKLLTLGFVALSLTASAQNAQNPVPTEKASKEAFDLAKLLYTPEQHGQQLDAAVAGTIAQLAGKPGVKVDNVKLKAAFGKLLQYQDMVDFQAGVLAKYYNSRELAELGAFYATPLGKKTLSILPQLTQDAMGFVMQLMGTPEAKEILKSAFTPTSEPKPAPVKGDGKR